MVLGRDRRAALTTPPGDITAWTVADVARALRRARTAQGLRVDEVGQAAGVAARDLQALESGDLDRFPDSLSALRAARRSADYLGLPGDQLALVLMERWPLRARGPAAPDEPTSVVPAVAGEPTITTTTVEAAAPESGPPTAVVDGGRRKAARRGERRGVAAGSAPETSEVLIDDVRRHGERVDGDGHLGSEPDDDGVDGDVSWDETDAVLVGAGAGSRRRPAVAGEPDGTPPVWLRAVVVAVVVAVLAGVAGILVHNHVGTHSPNTAVSTSTTHSSTKKSTPTTAKVDFTTHQTSPTTADLVVRAASFTVTISAVKGPAWIQVTAPTKSAPIYSGMLYAGQNHSFPVQTSITVETGSVAGHAAVTVGTKQVGTYTPPAAPFYMTFKSA